MKRTPRRTSAPSEGSKPATGSPAVASSAKSSSAGARPQDARDGNGRVKRLLSNISNATSESFPESSPVELEKKRIIRRLLDQCEAVGWPFKKRLILANLNLSYEEIPTEMICSEKLGHLLHKLSLRGNPRIGSFPDPFVTRLRGLRSLDLTNCQLSELPELWDLPHLKKLGLGRNKFSHFPGVNIFQGVPMLEHLEIYSNNITELHITDPSVLSNLQYLNLDYNSIETIPAEDLIKLSSLKTVRFMNNRIQTVPELICEMDLKVLDVSSNPLIQPPLETCARGLCSMRRYYKCLRAEEENKTSKSANFIKATARKMKAFPASLGGMFRSVSEPTGSRDIQSTDESITTELIEEETEVIVGFDEAKTKAGEVAINDSLKVIFVGMALSGKTSIIKRIVEGREARIPTTDDRTIGVDIYPWKPGKEKLGYEKPDMNCQIDVQEDIRSRLKAPIDVKFSLMDFAGQDVYHATHELFFSSQTLYVLVWDMANSIPIIMKTSSLDDDDQGDFTLQYDSSDDEDYFFENVEMRRAIRALEKDIDEKLNFWVHTIQSSAPGAAILPVASFDDYFPEHEATFRCKFMRERLLKKEALRVEGMKQRLAKFQSSQEGECPEAEMLRRLLCPFNRPKLIFGIDREQDVIRVSCKDFTGFDRLSAGIVNVATGREQGGWPYPLFRGHIGVRIPRMRLEVRDLVRKMRSSFKVVETGYFLSELEKNSGVFQLEDVSDALHFLTNIGECAYFGEVMSSSREGSVQQDRSGSGSTIVPQNSHSNVNHVSHEDDSSNKSVSSSSPLRQSSWMSSFESNKPSKFDEYIFLNPRWLVAAVACILRHDLTREIYEVRRLVNQTANLNLSHELSEMLDTNVNYPVISSQDMHLLWETKRFTKKAAVRALKYSNNTQRHVFDFLQQVLVRFSVFVPVDLQIDRTCLGGRDYTPNSLTCDSDQEDKAPKFFFLPSLLGHEEPKDAWTFKTVDSWKTTLCHTVLFPDGAPPGLMERLTGSILNDFMTIGTAAPDGITDRDLRLKETFCWRTAFLLRIAIDVIDGGILVESLVDIFVSLVDQESSYCVASDSMGIGMRRLIISARGQAGDYGSKIWKGGYMRVLVMIKRYLQSEYGGLEFDFQTVCPTCLAKRGIASVGVWNISTLLSLAETDSMIRCRYGHSTDIRLITALQGAFAKIVIRTNTTSMSYLQPSNDTDGFSLYDAFKSVVFVGLWDEGSRKMVRVGSGFIADKKRGFIVTAGHTLLDENTWREPRGGKIVIGIIPPDSENVCCFRYFARIISKDPSINEKGLCTVDACVLQLTTRMENDVYSSGIEIGEQPEKLLMNPELMKMEDLNSLDMTDKVELDETIRILGFNQGGEGLLEPGSESELVKINRSADFARGYVVMRFATTEAIVDSDKFQPRSEIVVICPTIGGHSGGPCLNLQGEVIGILSRADPADNQRCYLVPTSEFRPLLKAAKRSLAQSGQS